MLAGMPLTFALDFDPGAVDQQVQRALGAPIRDVDGEGLLAARQRAEVGHCPVKADQPQQAFDEAGRLPQRHAEQHLHREAGLDGGIAVGLLSATSTRRRRLPDHLGVKPDRQRASTLERLIVGRPVPGLVGQACGSAHADQLPCWTHDMNHRRNLCNRAVSRRNSLTRREDQRHRKGCRDRIVPWQPSAHRHCPERLHHHQICQASSIDVAAVLRAAGHG